MPQLNADRYVVEIEASTAGLAEILAEHDQSLPIPTCPEWTLRQLVTHRWPGAPVGGRDLAHAV